MKLIKSALRNRMYVETLDALMAIELLGKRYIVDADDEGVETKFFEEVLDDWENARLRNPNRARLNNQNAKKMAKTRTEIPNDVEALIPADTVDDDGSANVGLLDLDEASDLCEGGAAAALIPASVYVNTDVRADIEAFVIPGNCGLVELCPEIKAKELKKTGKFSYKFAE